jgi:hypothetical protein
MAFGAAIRSGFDGVRLHGVTRRAVHEADANGLGRAFLGGDLGIEIPRQLMLNNAITLNSVRWKPNGRRFNLAAGSGTTRLFNG